MIQETIKYLENEIAQGHIPGAALAFVEKDNIKTFSLGYSQLIPNKVTNTKDTIYDLASLTKVIATTTLILQCLDKDYFSLDTKVKNILHDFPYQDITVEHLLLHTSGMVADDKRYKETTNKQEMRDFVYSLDTENTPNSKVEYSDFGFITLGFIIEHFLGDLNEAAQEYIFKPLNMNHTLFNPLEKYPEAQYAATEITEHRGVIIGDVHDGKAHIMGGVSGHAGLFSTINDVSLFVQSFLDQKHTVISNTSLSLLKECRTQGLNLRRTLGWFSDEPTTNMGLYYSTSCLFHTGFAGTSIYIDFVRGCGIVLLTNRVHPSRDNQYIFQIRNRVHDLLLKSYGLSTL